MIVDHEVRGLDSLGEALIRVRASAEHQTRDLASEAGDAAKAMMLAKVPRSGKTGQDTIAGSIRKLETAYRPGGAGGGGFFEVRVGPGEDAPEHLRWVMGGTGEYGPLGRVIRGHNGGVLAIQKRGEGVRFRQFARGQRPQRQWYDDAVDVADQIVAEGIRSLRIGRA